MNNKPIDDGGPAYPTVDYVPNGDGTQHCTTYNGMALRDYFAGQALAGMLANENVTMKRGVVTSSAYEYADAMLAARKDAK